MKMKTIAGFLSLLVTFAMAQDAREFRVAPGLAEPLWLSLAGRKVQGHRAHVLVEFAGPAKSQPGLTLLEPAGGNVYFAALDLSSPAGSELQSGNARALARLSLRGLRAIQEEDKLPRSLPKAAFVNARQTAAGFDLYFFADTDLVQARTDLAALGIEPERVSEFFQRMRITAEPALLKRIASLDWVQYLTPEPAAKRKYNNRDSGTMIQVNTLQGPDFQLTGRDVSLGIIDADLPSVHREFTGRLTNMENRSAIGGGQTHSTHVAGTMIAAGEFDQNLRGMATASRLHAWHFLGDEAQKMANGPAEIVAFNNSWGIVIDDSIGNCNDFGGYGSTERDLDRLARERNVSLVFATGNDRDLPICSLLPQAGYYSAGRPSSAKNTIAVGAVRASGQISEFSGTGPARDGRIKPDLVALGVGVRSTSLTSSALTLEGTSMAAPAVTGTIGLLTERYKSAKGGERPPADLMKAILLNTAKDMGNPGPDYTYGYGLVQAEQAAKTIDENRFARNRVGAGGEKTHEFEVPAGASALRVLLAYADLPAAPDARSAIINHIDIELNGPGGVKALPLGLDPFKPQEAARPRAGIRDVSKQIVIDRPAAGKWTLTVKGLEVAEGEQDYAVTWTFAENPAPACSATLSTTLALADSQAEVQLLHVNANSHCDAWQVTNVPDWLRVVGGNQKGTGVVKLAFAEHSGDGARETRLNIADQTVRVRQNPRCITPIAIGQTIEARLNPADCLVEIVGFFGESTPVYLRKYEFKGVQGQTVAIHMITPRNGLDGYLSLRAEGDVILQEDDDSGGNFAAGDFSARIPFAGGFYVLPYTGTYTIWASGSPDSPRVLDTGPYALRLEEGPPVPGGPLTPRVITNCPAQSTGELTTNSSTAGRRGDLFRTDVYQFFARLGAQVTIEMPDAAFDPYVYLISPSNALVGSITDDGSNTRRLSLAAPRTGTYSIEVTSFAPFLTGEYSLRVQGCSPQ